MSSWIHANGFMVITPYYKDEEIGKEIKEKIANALGEIINCEDVTKTLACKHMPCGSEGSLKYEIIESEYSIYVAISGDLRDRYTEDLDKIEKWYKDAVEEISNIDFCYLDRHVFTAYAEYGGRIVMYDDCLKVGVIRC